MTRSLLVIVFEPLHADVVAPVRATRGAAGYDLCAYLRGRAVKGSRRAPTARAGSAPSAEQIPNISGGVRHHR